MKRCGLFMAIAALALSSCDVVTHGQVSLGSANYSAVSEVRSSKSGRGTSSGFGHSMTSYDLVDDPTSIYAREDKQLITNSSFRGDVWHIRNLVTNSFSSMWFRFTLHGEESYANVIVVGQTNTGATVRGFSSGVVARGYGGTGEYLDGRNLEGVEGGGFFYVTLTGQACRHPSEAFFRITFFAKDNLEAITGYALVVAYPCGEPVEATDPNADIESPDLSEREPGPVWLDWTVGVVCEGVHFPKVEGLYQRIDPNRVNAALDMMIENAKGRYFSN